jgi:SpoVK/Ycf46/Vps4 family AAA+-type ATPase
LQQDFSETKETVYFKSMSAVEMLSRVVGGAEEFIRKTFNELRSKKPAILTIDDLHLLFGAKEVSSH